MSHQTYVEALLERARKASRRVRDAVEERWQQTNTGKVPRGLDVVELAATAGLPDLTVRHISLLVDLHRETVAAVNKSVVRGPWGVWGDWYIRREVRRAVKIIERNASAILESIEKLRF